MTTTVTGRARELLDAIRARNGELRCYVAVDEARVLADAAALDGVAPAERGPLHGLALAVKDIIDVAGLPTRAGSSFFRRDPAHDAPVVAALRAAGALVIGKTNTHEFAWGITTENPHFGRAANPRDPRRTPGGSSGGSAAAVAAQLADLALGTDTLGSMRIPAALTGVYGFRPATGAFSLDGIVPLALGLDTVGAFARDAATLRRAYEALAGAPLAPKTPGRVARLRGGRWDAVTTEQRAALDAACAALRSAGIDVVDVAWWDDALPPAVAVVQQRAAAAVHRDWYAANPDGYGADVGARVAAALKLGAADEAAARVTIDRVRASWTAALDGCALALAPVVAGEAPLAPVPASFRAETMPLVTPASAFALPAVAAPIGTGPSGMPLGMQIIALDGEIAAAFALAPTAAGA